MEFQFLTTLSFLSFALNIFRISPDYNNALFSVNWICLVGFLVMVLLNPHGFFERYVSTFQFMANRIVNGLGNMITEPVFYLGAFAFHVAPILAFRNTYSLGPAMWPMLLYLIVFGPYLERIYPLESRMVVFIGIIEILGIELYRHRKSNGML